MGDSADILTGGCTGGMCKEDGSRSGGCASGGLTFPKAG